MKKIPATGLIILFLGALVVLAGGCATAGGKAKAQREKLQRQNFAHLYHDVVHQKLSKGTLSEAILKKYGKPTNRMNSASNTSSFEVWSYQKPNKDNPENWEQIRLYFNNHRLVSWIY